MTRRPDLRRRLWLAGVLPALLLLAISARTVGLLVGQAAGESDYSAERYPAAGQHFALNRVLNPVVRWVAPFNEGAALHADERHGDAVRAYRAALDLAPEPWQCVVRNDLATALEARGVAEQEDGLLSEAITTWEEARVVLEECLPDAAEQAALGLDPDLDDLAELDQLADELADDLADDLANDLADERTTGSADALTAPPGLQTTRRTTAIVERRLQARLADQPDPDRREPPEIEPPDEAELAEVVERDREARERRREAQARQQERQSAEQTETDAEGADQPNW